MSLLKKTNFRPDEIQIFDDAIIYKRGRYWQFRMWLSKEGKYARFSLRTPNRATATDKAKQRYHELMSQQLQGKTYFSKTTAQGVEQYLAQRLKDMEAGLIVKGRYGTIKTHLEHWLEFIGRDEKLKELERTDCENYYHARTKTKKNIQISQTTVLNEQSTINAMMSWLYKCKETHIEAFDFKKLKRIDKGNEALRRSSFTDDEVTSIVKILRADVDSYRKNINAGQTTFDDTTSLTALLVSYYFLFSIVSGLRRGEQLQLKWGDVTTMSGSNPVKSGKQIDLIKIIVRAEITKVRRSREFAIRDNGYFQELFRLLWPKFQRANEESGFEEFEETLIFSADGVSPLTARSLEYHFDRILKLAKIIKTSKRDLVPYSFRHYFITRKINSGLPPVAVAEMCGTSANQVQQTYYHTTKEKMISNAIADYKIVDGMIIPKHAVI